MNNRVEHVERVGGGRFVGRFLTQRRRVRRGDFRAGAVPQTPKDAESQEFSSHSGYGGMRQRNFASKGGFSDAEPEGYASMREPHLQIISANSASLRLCVEITPRN